MIGNKTINTTFSNQSLIDSFMVRDRVTCLFQCNLNPNCFASTLKIDGTCTLFSQLALNYLASDGSIMLYQRIQTYNVYFNTFLINDNDIILFYL